MALSFSFELPTHRVDQAEEFVSAATIAEIAQAAEQAGFHAVHLTDHPAPDAKWLQFGGHHAIDPFVGLAFAAAATTSIRLLTNIYVAAYRNPFLGAKTIQSLTVLSGERLILGTGAGYLKPEFFALGADFDHRGERLDEALDVLRQVMTGQDVAFDGAGFSARGVRLAPVPSSPLQPPIWIGGNSKASVRRAVTKHQGWAPFVTGGYASASRTASIDDLDDLAAAIAAARELATEVGRTEPLDICLSAGTLIDPKLSLDERHSVLQRLEQLGVTWVPISLPGENRAALIEGLREFAKEFVE